MGYYAKFPYRSEFADSRGEARNHQSLEDALSWARLIIHARWRETNEHGIQGQYIYDAATAVITNRNTGYRWILRRGERVVEFETNDMLEEVIAQEGIDVHLSIEEAEALARTAKAATVSDKRTRALTAQALDQIGMLCRQVREAVRVGESFVDAGTRSIPRKLVREPHQSPSPCEPVRSPPSRSLGDPDNLSLKEAGEILGKTRNTLHLWYRQGKFPPAVDVAVHLGANKPVIVVPRYRLEAWQANERLPKILQEVFQSHGLHEPPWICWSARRGASGEDIEFWIRRRRWQTGTSKEGRRIFGEGLTDTVYELVSTVG